MPLLLLLGEPPLAVIDLASFDGYTPISGLIVGPPVQTDIDVMSFDGASPIVGPNVSRKVPVPPPVPPPGPTPVPTPGPPPAPPPNLFEPGMYAELWTTAIGGTPAVFLSSLATQSGVRFQDAFNDVGSGSLQIMLDDPDAAMLIPGREIRCFMFGTEVFTWEILTKPQISRWAEGEEASQTLSVSGKGRAALLATSKVYPPKGLENPVNAQHRLYSFAAIDFPNYQTWRQAVESWPAGVVNPERAQVVEYTTDQFFGLEKVVEKVTVPAPYGWPVPEAFWIWSQDETHQVGTSYFRRVFTLTSEQNIAFMVTGDNYYTLYLDGTPIVGELVNMHCWQEYKRVDIKLPAGTYTLAAIVINAEWPPEYANPAGLLMAACILDGEGKLQEDEDDDNKIIGVLTVSDKSWTSLAYPGSEPGWTPGQILLDAIFEAQDRGVITGFVVDFTAFNDSLGNPWPFVPGFSVAIGGSILDILNGLVEQGWIDWRVKPGTQVLQAFIQKAIAINSGVTYSVTGDRSTQNVKSQDFSPQIEPINKYLVKWTYGYFEIADAASRAAWGTYEGFMTIDAPTVENALRQANAAMAATSTPVQAIVVEIDPLGDADSPYYAYGVGEMVYVLDADGSMAWKQVHGITIVQNDMGRPEAVLELEARLQERERENYNLLSGIGRTLTGDTKARNTKISFNSPKSATSS